MAAPASPRHTCLADWLWLSGCCCCATTRAGRCCRPSSCSFLSSLSNRIRGAVVSTCTRGPSHAFPSSVDVVRRRRRRRRPAPTPTSPQPGEAMGTAGPKRLRPRAHVTHTAASRTACMHGPGCCVLRLAGGRVRRVRPRGELVNPRRVTSDGDVASPTTPPQSSTPLRCANDNDRKLPATRFFRFLHNSLLLFYLLPFIEAAGSIYLQINKWW